MDDLDLDSEIKVPYLWVASFVAWSDMSNLLGFIVAKRNTTQEMRGHVVTPEGRTFLKVDFGHALWLDR